MGYFLGSAAKSARRRGIWEDGQSESESKGESRPEAAHSVVPLCRTIAMPSDVKSATQPDGLARHAFALMFIILLTAGSLWILRPFLTAAIWATMTVIATWPVLLRLEKILGRRSRAVVILTLAFLSILIIPVTLGVIAVVENARQVADQVQSAVTTGLPQVPAWLESVPVIGSRLAGAWNSVAADPDALAAFVTSHASGFYRAFASNLGGFGIMLVQFLLTVIIAAVLYSNGEKAARGIILAGRRLGGDAGERALILAAQSIRGIALGVVGTAIIQTLLAGLGLFAAGIPAAAVLSLIIFILAIAQLGPALVLIGAIAYLFQTGQTTAGAALLAWSIPVCLVDNILRPILIKQGVDLPFLLILSGVLGGLLAFGVIGIFVGPVILAVSYTLLENWVSPPEKPN
jgi:predicted PurR-regulated permease PerM